MTDSQTSNNTSWFRKRRIAVIAAGTLLAAGSAVGVQAVANSKTGAHMMVLASDGGWHGGWHGSWHRGPHGRFANMTDAEIEKKIERIVKHVAIEIDATPEQQQKIAALFVAVAKELKPMRGQMRDAGRKIHDLLLADKIDREALEKIRGERLADAERISKSVLNAVAEAAEILTPEQRRVLDERVRQFRSMRRGWGWGRGWHRG